MKISNQCDHGYGGKQLGTVPGTICQYGCYDCVLTGIANDSGHPTTPDGLNAALIAKKIFVQGDLLPDVVLDQLWPGEYTTTHFAGYRPDLVRPAILSPDTYVIFWITGYSPGWKMNIVTHFVHGWSADGQYIGDPEGGVVRPISFYGGTLNIHKTILVKHHRPAPPVVTPAAPPVYSVTVGDAVLGASLSYDTAVLAARGFAAKRPGTLAAVKNDKGETVETEFVAPPPGPIAPAQIPIPTLIVTSEKDPSGWADLFHAINVIVLQLRGLTQK